MGLYVETTIHSSLDKLWRLTQIPELHARWDLRFTSIQYLPRESESEPQKFLYQTHLGFGLPIAGEGESITTRIDGKGRRTSSLRFWSDDSRSLIREGSGYWQYTPLAEGVRFVTDYDYGTRLGRFGSALDRAVFRPLMHWATAWSFDRLRLWIERGIDPDTSLERTAIHATTRVALALVWLWHGIVPKLISHHSGEMEPLMRLGLSWPVASALVLAAGVLEIGLALANLVLWSWRPLFLIQAAFLIALSLGALATVPGLWGQPFTPVTLTVALVALCFIGYLSGRNLPSAFRCKLKKEAGQ